MMDRPRIQEIWDNAVFREALAAIENAEADRVFCRHGLPHLLDVARIAWMLNVERAAGLAREVVYAAALLHDIGRAEQYATGEPHDKAGIRLAWEVLDSLPEGTFSEEECRAIVCAVGEHRGSRACGERRADPAADADMDVFAALIREADRRSRPCYACSARPLCKWPDEKKNLAIDM